MPLKKAGRDRSGGEEEGRGGHVAGFLPLNGLEGSGGQIPWVQGSSFSRARHTKESQSVVMMSHDKNGGETHCGVVLP